MIYGTLASLYDRMMSHVDYRQWARMVRDIIRDYSEVRHPSIMEVGAGTGILGKILRSEGWKYQGSDLSFAMCRQARQRGLSFFCADARCLPVRKKFDMVLFLYDGINYLLTADDYKRLFTEISQCIRIGGLFLFDITTEANSLRNFADLWIWEDNGESCCMRHSYYDRQRRLQYNDFVVFIRRCDGSYLRSDEHHVQCVTSVKEILRRIPYADFELLGIWDGFTRRKGGVNSERIHFLLRKHGAR